MDRQTWNTRPKIIRKARQWRYVWDSTLGMSVKKCSLSPLSHHGYIFHLEAIYCNCLAPIAWQASEIYSSRVPNSGGLDTRVESPGTMKYRNHWFKETAVMVRIPFTLGAGLLKIKMDEKSTWQQKGNVLTPISWNLHLTELFKPNLTKSTERSSG